MLNLLGFHSCSIQLLISLLHIQFIHKYDFWLGEPQHMIGSVFYCLKLYMIHTHIQEFLIVQLCQVLQIKNNTIYGHSFINFSKKLHIH